MLAGCIPNHVHQSDPTLLLAMADVDHNMVKDADA